MKHKKSTIIPEEAVFRLVSKRTNIQTNLRLTNKYQQYKIIVGAWMDRTSARYVQKAVTFHLDFAPEIVEESRYGMQTLYSLEHLELANKALGRK